MSFQHVVAMANTYLRRYTDAFLGQDRSELHAAAFQGQLMTIYGLIQQGADVNKKTSDGVTPLHEACSRGFFYCCELLVKHGADVAAYNIDGSTPLCDACCQGNVEIVKFLLSKGADPNPPMARTSPLHEAALRGHTDCVRELIKAGSKLEVTDGHYGTALHSACYTGKTETAEVILNAGGSANAIMNHTSLLHVAVSVNASDLVQLLLDYGANIYARNNREKAPFQLAGIDSKTMKILDDHMSHPRPLSELCRWRIRRLLGPQRLDKLDKLGLPKVISNYVQFR
ncbi:ankyrin repeat and SOCS box protein 13-like [Diadema antillarum]|uniref:ankyrin repeat and SOCS box protein 13-like n=1 Tax=Diadema antillarum TaxID=105358 RepID=UPI003A888E38